MPKRIVILRALQLGDMLCAVPAFRALRAALPEAKITLVGLPWAHVFVDRFHNYLDNFLEFPGFPGFPERLPDIHRIPGFLSQAQAHDFDLAIQMQGSGNISNPLIMLLGSKLNAGFYLRGQFCPDLDRFLSYPVHEPEIWRHLRLMEHLGIPVQGEHLEFPLTPADQLELERLSASYDLHRGEYVCLHPGARSYERRWPVEWFAEVGNALSDRGYRVVLTGTREEAALTQHVAERMTFSTVNLAGHTTLGGLAALLSCARLLVSNDTGVSHLADAMNTPSIVLYTASDPNRWAPLDRKLHRVIAWATAAVPTIVIDEIDSLMQQERMYVS